MPVEEEVDEVLDEDEVPDAETSLYVTITPDVVGVREFADTFYTQLFPISTMVPPEMLRLYACIWLATVDAFTP